MDCSSPQPCGLVCWPPLVLQAAHGAVYVLVGTTEVVLYSRTSFGNLSAAQFVSLNAGVTQMNLGLATTCPRKLPPQYRADRVPLTEQEQTDVGFLLLMYESVISARDGDLGCTNLLNTFPQL